MKMILIFLIASGIHGHKIIETHNTSAKVLMRRISHYYHLRPTVFAPGFPLHNMSIIGQGAIVLDDKTPAVLAEDLKYYGLSVEFCGDHFYVKQLP